MREAIVFVVNRCGTFRKQVAMDIAQHFHHNLLPIHQNPKCQKMMMKKNSIAQEENLLFQAIPKEDWKPRNAYKENYQLYSKYKYCLVMENTPVATDNYITEKLFLAFMGGCLPIYWGTKDVFELFNPDAFVFYDYDYAITADDNDNNHASNNAIGELQYLQANRTYYDWKMEQPILAHGPASAEAYLSLSEDVGNGRLRTRIRNMLGIEN
ncbi:MAG: hypothetical protein SGBAC_009980 [Bacillariaceae sp.]